MARRIDGGDVERTLDAKYGLRYPSFPGLLCNRGKLARGGPYIPFMVC